MGDFPLKLDVDKVISYGDDLILCLKNKRDLDTLKQSLDGIKMLQSSCETDFSEIKNLLEEYQTRITECKKKIDNAKSGVIADADIDSLQKDLLEELNKENKLQEELRIVSDEMSNLEHQRVSIEGRKQILKKREREELRAQMELSMYASVTKIIPDLADQNQISGHIVDRDKRMVKQFKFEPSKVSPFEMCNDLWKMINL
ncbi:kinetochore protein SPC24 homolog isoform X2 [Macadamia integrifolia]|uniref:kinetochore protein SPC24 homolog isoform X2 n=1 Tax=Macadamia integrifolia TaxID=60698 RepID=UPI001C5026F2|nr:kinetochore protein SPC24 homolog isoform X2 [Macadamia integrifolia]